VWYIQVKLSLYLVKPLNKDWQGNGGVTPRILSSTLNGVKSSASRLGSFTPEERAPSTPWTEGWVDLRVGLNAVTKRKFRVFAENRSPFFHHIAETLHQASEPSRFSVSGGSCPGSHYVARPAAEGQMRCVRGRTAAASTGSGLDFSPLPHLLPKSV
jgi:hypothetical protein